MRPGRFLILLVLTVAVSVAAVASYLDRQSGDALDLAGDPVLPGLADRVAEVRTVEVETSDGGYTLKRRGDAWVAASKHGYPVKAGRVNRTLVGLARLEKLEPKTRRPELYHKLQVADPSGAGARSRLVRLRGGDGEVLAELIVGGQRHAKTGRADSGTYVRRPGDARAWLAAGLVDLSDGVYPWLRREVVDIAPAAIERIALRPRGAAPLIAVRPERGAKAWGLAGVPDGRRPDVAEVRKLGTVLDAIKLDDVRPAGALDFAEPDTHAEVVTFDGLRVAVEVLRHGGATWLRLTVDTADGAAPSARRRAMRLDARVDGWAYKVPAYVGERLSRSLDDVLAPASG